MTGLQRASQRDITSDTKSTDGTIVHASHHPYDDRLSQADREVVTRESEPVRPWRVTTLPAAASYLRRWPVDSDRPIRPRSLSEAGDNGKRAFRALADWITIYLFVLVETGRLPQDGAIECVFPPNLVGYMASNFFLQQTAPMEIHDGIPVH